MERETVPFPGVAASGDVEYVEEKLAEIDAEIRSRRKSRARCQRCHVPIRVVRKDGDEDGHKSWAAAMLRPREFCIAHDYDPEYDEPPTQECERVIIPNGLLNLYPPEHPDKLLELCCDVDPEWRERELKELARYQERRT